MKTTLIITLSSLLICTIIFAQNSKSLEAKSISNSSIESVKKTSVSSPIKDETKPQILGTWKFHEITIRTPKDGYLVHIAAQETNIIKLLIANYTFNNDGSITLDPKYIEKQGVKEAKWKFSDTGKLTITYFWSPEKMKENDIPASESKVEMDYKVTITPGEELTLNWQGVFIINLKK